MIYKKIGRGGGRYVWGFSSEARALQEGLGFCQDGLRELKELEKGCLEAGEYVRHQDPERDDE